MEKQKRVLAVHDISCFGKCSLTVALPIISACGIETTVIPTAVLSTHTGGFTGFTYRDLTEDINPIVDHFQTLEISFDGIYTGFLGSKEQIEIVSNMIDKFKDENNLILIDPVMADNGILYSVFDEHFPNQMKNLCKKADIIVPNITEAHLLINKPYVKGPYDKKYIENILFELSKICANKIVLTGVYFDEEKLGAVSYDVHSDEINYVLDEKIEGIFHGTGDIFGSVLLSSVLSGFSLHESTKISVSFVLECIKRTKKANTDLRFGVNFEQSLPSLLKLLNLVK